MYGLLTPMTFMFTGCY